MWASSSPWQHNISSRLPLQFRPRVVYVNFRCQHRAKATHYSWVHWVNPPHIVAPQKHLPSLPLAQNTKLTPLWCQPSFSSSMFSPNTNLCLSCISMTVRFFSSMVEWVKSFFAMFFVFKILFRLISLAHHPKITQRMHLLALNGSHCESLQFLFGAAFSFFALLKALLLCALNENGIYLWRCCIA